MTTPKTAIVIDPEPEEALRDKLMSDVSALPAAQLLVRPRLQQDRSRFKEYEKTWEFSAYHSRLLSKEALAHGWTIVGALFLRPCLIEPGWVGTVEPAELVFLPELFWFRLRRRNKLKSLMVRVAEAVDIEPSRLYFYYQGAQVNPQSTVAQVCRPLFSSALTY
jgi:hypothetical protein